MLNASARICRTIDSRILVFFTTFLAAGLAVLIGWFALQRMGAEALAEDVSEHLLDESPRVLKDESLSSISIWAKLLERSGLRIDDIDLYFPYDGFTIITLGWIENSGWCGSGRTIWSCRPSSSPVAWSPAPTSARSSVRT